MLRLSRPTRLLCCRSAFVAACLLPTVVVAACALWRHLPAHVQAEQRVLSGHLGLPTRLTGVSHPRPGLVVYHGLQILDPETARPLLKARLLDADRTGAALILNASQLEIDGSGSGRLWRLLRQRLADQAAETDIELLAGEVTLGGRQQSHTLTEVSGGIDRSETGGTSWLRFRVVALDMPQPAEVRVARNRDGAATLLSLETGSATLPCSLLSAVLPEIDRLGPAAGFTGSIHAEQSDKHTDEGWRGKLAGDFTDVDLYWLVTAHFPHRLNGPARLKVSNAQFRRGRLHSASGELTAGPGVVSRSLLDAAAASLGALRPGLASATDTPILYEQLAVRFSIDESGLRLAGQCGRPDSGRIMANRSGVLLADPPSQPLPVVSLVRTLVPDNAVQVPATRETEPLVGWLPVPHIRRSRPAGAGEATPSGRLLRLPR